MTTGNFFFAGSSSSILLLHAEVYQGPVHFQSSSILLYYSLTSNIIHANDLNHNIYINDSDTDISTSSISSELHSYITIHLLDDPTCML